MRYMTTYGLSEYDSGVLVQQREIAEYYDRCTALYDNYKSICNWLTGDILAYLNAERIPISEIKVSPEALTRMVRLVDSDKISSRIGKMLIEEMLKTGGDPEKIIEEKGWVQISDTSAIDAVIDKMDRRQPTAGRPSTGPAIRKSPALVHGADHESDRRQGEPQDRLRAPQAEAPPNRLSPLVR